VKGSNNVCSGCGRNWCKKRALEEQRLFEMAKLRSQFEGLLADVGLGHLGVKQPLMLIYSFVRLFS
jgi:hypothetical protein